VRKVTPGTVLSFALAAPGDAPEEHVYWSAGETVDDALRQPLRDNVPDIITALDDLLRRVIAREMIADVPLGAFLSGGVDSSTIVALMQAQSDRPVRTFTIGFAERQYDEAGYAKAVAMQLGTDHTELYVSSADLLDVVPRLARVYDEPFADSSQVPTALLAALTRRHVTVSLSGDGGDELFGGYVRYRRGAWLWNVLGRVPRPLRRGLAWATRRVTAGGGDMSGGRVRQWAPLLGADTMEGMYSELVSSCREPMKLGMRNVDLAGAFKDQMRSARTASVFERMMFLDLTSYLPDDILVKVDRATMAASLESRAPFLDHEVVNFAWRVPWAIRTRNGGRKWLLRQLLYRYVSPDLVDRPKMGFAVPLDAWLRGPLREWAGDLLAPAKLRRDGFLNAATVTRTWERQQAGEARLGGIMWAVLMFQAWLEGHA
jgi:asparagine synthase (glutamine-hydrolysing)